MSLKLARYDLVQHGKTLATRTKGREAAGLAAGQLADEGQLLLNFHGVEVASPPFLDELVRAVRAVLTTGDKRWLLITGANEDVEESLQMVLERQKMALVVMEDQHMKLVGGSSQLAHTLRAAAEMESFTAPELAEHLQLKLPAVHQRLSALVEAGALHRVDDPTATRGKRHKYHTPSRGEVAAAAGEAGGVREVTSA